MNFKSIHYFLATERHRSFTKAAAQLHITQQTLSADISALERELGQALFQRKVPLQLTYAGEVFLRYAQNFQREYNSMLREFSDIAGNQTGILRIGVTYARGHALMPQLIAEFQKQYPRIAVHLVEDSNEQLRKHLLEGTVDIAIANFPQGYTDIHQLPFYQEEMVLLIADRLMEQIYKEKKEQVLNRLLQGAYEDLNCCPFVLGIPDDIGGNIGRQFLSSHRLQPSIQAQSENMDTLLSLCALGIGACFSPENLIRMTLSDSQIAGLHVFHLPDAAYPIHFGVRKDHYRWSMIEAFIQIAVSTRNKKTRES